MRNKKRFIALVLAVLLAFSLCACGTRTASGPEESKDTSTDISGATETEASSDVSSSQEPSSTASESSEKAEELPYTVVTSLKDAKAGDVIVFGAYEQDGDESDGKEPLEWLVLAGENGSLFVITLYGVEHMQFHSSLNKVTWETSAVRAWLNNDFLGAAFSASETAKIKTTHVIAEKNPQYPNSPAGNDTDDKVFLLSVQEAEQYFADNNARKCAPTAAAIASEPAVFSNMSAKAWYTKQSYGCSWWLRSPGMFKDIYVSYVGKYGDITGGGQVYLSGTDFCVRPAMWIPVA